MSLDASKNIIPGTEGALIQPKGFIFESEDERLLRDASRPAIEKLHLFTKMIRRNSMLNIMQSQSKKP